MDSRGADGQAAPILFETGMGEAPEACLLPKLVLPAHLPARPPACPPARPPACLSCPPSVWRASLQALDMCVRLMLRGEVAALSSSWRYAYEGRQDAPQVCDHVHVLTGTATAT